MPASAFAAAQGGRSRNRHAPDRSHPPRGTDGFSARDDRAPKRYERTSDLSAPVRLDLPRSSSAPSTPPPRDPLCPFEHDSAVYALPGLQLVTVLVYRTFTCLRGRMERITGHGGGPAQTMTGGIKDVVELTVRLSNGKEDFIFIESAGTEDSLINWFEYTSGRIGRVELRLSARFAPVTKACGSGSAKQVAQARLCARRQV